MTRRLGKQIATVLLAVSLAGCGSANPEAPAPSGDPEKRATSKYREGLAAYWAEDYGLALIKFSDATVAGNTDAQYSLGILYAKGQGVPQNRAEAAKWYRIAARDRFATVQRELALMYDDGHLLDVPNNGRNNGRFYVWESLAAAHEHEDAKKNRDITANQLTPEQLARGQEVPARCFESNYKDGNL